MEHTITNQVFSPMKQSNGLQGYIQLVVDNSLFLDGILVYKNNDGEIVFKTPAKKLKNSGGGLIPYYQIIDKALQKQILDSIKEEMQKAETERFFNVAKED